MRSGCEMDPFPCLFFWKTTLFQDQVGCVIPSCAGLHSWKVFHSKEKTESYSCPFWSQSRAREIKKKKRSAEELSQGDISEDTQIYGSACSWQSFELSQQKQNEAHGEWFHGEFSPLKLSVNINNLIVIKTTFRRIIKWQWNNNDYYSYIISSSHVQMWELDQKEGWVPKYWCVRIVVLEKTLKESLGLQGDLTSPS